MVYNYYTRLQPPRYWFKGGVKNGISQFLCISFNLPPRQKPVHATDLVTTYIGFDQYKLTDRDATSIFLY